MKNAWRGAMRVGMVVLSLVVSTMLIAGCGSGGGGSGGTPSATAQKGTVSGRVTSSADGSAVAGATVSTTAGSTTSAEDGSFTVAAGAGERTVVHVEATGFAEAFPVARVTAGQTTKVGVRLLTTGVSMPVTVASGGTVTVPNSSAQVSIPASGLVPKSGGAAAGTVNVAVTPINPAVDLNLMPGDFTAVSAGGGSPVPIESFGAMLIDIRDNSGTRYNLAEGKTSTIRIPVGTLSTNPPATIPLFFFDESTGLWKEEGQATLQGQPGNQYYEGTVTHFSYWNADFLYDAVYVSGCVRDSNNQPVPNLLVRTNGLDYSGAAIAYTAADGTFRVAMRPGSLATLSASVFDVQTFTYTSLTNTVTVGPSDVDFTLPTCLVTSFAITSSSTLPAGTVDTVYSTSLVASGGTPALSWSVISGVLPVGLTLNPSTGQISGTPTTAGSSTFTIRVQDSGTPQQSAEKQFSLTTISSGGGGGTLSLTGAPATTGGAFVADPQYTVTAIGVSADGGDAVEWVEAPQNSTHLEDVELGFHPTGELYYVGFNNVDLPVGYSWGCWGPGPIELPLCSGVTVNRTAGTVNFANTVLTDTGASPFPPITVNGTLNFTPF